MKFMHHALGLYVLDCPWPLPYTVGICQRKVTHTDKRIEAKDGVVKKEKQNKTRKDELNAEGK